MNACEQTTAELLLQVRALENVADSLESEGLYEAQLVRASAKRISKQTTQLNDAAFKSEREGS